MLTDKFAIVRDIIFRDRSIFYLIKFLHDSEIVERMESNLTDVLINKLEESSSDSSWLRDRVKATVYFPSFMSTAK